MKYKLCDDYIRPQLSYWTNSNTQIFLGSSIFMEIKANFLVNLKIEIEYL